MKISAVIPFYAEWDDVRPLFLHHAGACLNSVLAQPFVSEIILVDDGSARIAASALDQAIAALACEPENHGRDIIVVRHAYNLGPSAARNTGLRMVTNDWCLILDSDDRIVSLDAQLSALQFAEKQIGYVMGSWRSFDDKGTSFALNAPELPSIAQLCLRNLTPITAIIRVEAWRQLREKNGQGYDEEVVRLGGGEDWLFWLELLSLGWKGIAAPGLMWEYRVNEESQRTKRDKNTFLIRAYVAQKMKRYNVFVPMEYPT